MGRIVKAQRKGNGNVFHAHILHCKGTSKFQAAKPTECNSQVTENINGNYEFQFIDNYIVNELNSNKENPKYLKRVNDLVNQCLSVAITKKNEVKKPDNIKFKENEVLKVFPQLNYQKVSSLITISDCLSYTILHQGASEYFGKKMSIIPLKRRQYRDRNLIIDWFYSNLDVLKPLINCTKIDYYPPKKVKRMRKR